MTSSCLNVRVATALRRACCIAILALVAAPMASADPPKGPEPEAGTLAAEVGNGGGGVPFEDVPGEGFVLVGFEITTAPFGNHEIINSVEPLYENAAGERHRGALRGQPTLWRLRVEAEEGYAVSQILGMAGDRIDGFRMVFARRNPEPGKQPDQYLSRWIGAHTGNQMKIVAGQPGQVARGIKGRCGAAVDGLSLVY